MVVSPDSNGRALKISVRQGGGGGEWAEGGREPSDAIRGPDLSPAGGGANPTLEATQVQIDGFFSQLATRIGWHLREIDLIFAPGLPPGRRGR